MHSLISSLLFEYFIYVNLQIMRLKQEGAIAREIFIKQYLKQFDKLVGTIYFN